MDNSGIVIIVICSTRINSRKQVTAEGRERENGALGERVGERARFFVTVPREAVIWSPLTLVV